MGFIKKNKNLFIAIVIVFLLVPAITFGRYIYTLIKDHYTITDNFYFYSDLLNENNPQYTISNWSGVDQYVLTVNMNSVLNDKKYATTDIDYEIEYECADKVNCYLSKDRGKILASDQIDRNRDSFTLTVVPKEAFVNNEKTTINVIAHATKPYKKDLSATFVLKASKIGLSYEITDHSKDIFSVLRLTNSLTYYTVKEAFGNYSVGDEIEQHVYSSFSSEDKKKCVSLSVELKFDPRVVTMDLTNAYYLRTLKNNPSNITTVKLRRVTKAFAKYKEDDLIDEITYNGLNDKQKSNVGEPFDYVNGIIIDIDAISSADIKFYKMDKLKDYTYPFVNKNSIIEVR